MFSDDAYSNPVEGHIVVGSTTPVSSGVIISPQLIVWDPENVFRIHIWTECRHIQANPNRHTNNHVIFLSHNFCENRVGRSDVNISRCRIWIHNAILLLDLPLWWSFCHEGTELWSGPTEIMKYWSHSTWEIDVSNMYPDDTYSNPFAGCIGVGSITPVSLGVNLSPQLIVWDP